MYCKKRSIRNKEKEKGIYKPLTFAVDLTEICPIFHE